MDNSRTSSTLIISRGPQFSGFKSTAGIGMSFVFLLAVIVSLVMGEFFYTLIFVPLLLIGISLTIGLEGVEIDQPNNKIRTYTIFLWFRYGEWKDLGYFGSLHLVRDRYLTMSYSGAVNRSRIMKTCFEVILKGEEDDCDIVFAEYNNYDAAKVFFRKYIEILNIKSYDHVKEQVEAAKEMRKIRGRR